MKFSLPDLPGYLNRRLVERLELFFFMSNSVSNPYGKNKNNQKLEGISLSYYDLHGEEKRKTYVRHGRPDIMLNGLLQCLEAAEFPKGLTYESKDQIPQRPEAPHHILHPSAFTLEKITLGKDLESREVFVAYVSYSSYTRQPYRVCIAIAPNFSQLIGGILLFMYAHRDIYPGIWYNELEQFSIQMYAKEHDEAKKLRASITGKSSNKITAKKKSKKQ